MAKSNKAKPIEVKSETVTPKIPLKEYRLKADYPTSKGIKKAGSKILASEGGAKLLKSKNII